MPTGSHMQSRLGLGLLFVVALVLAFAPMQVQAQGVDCSAVASDTADFDRDGLSDLLECNGIPLFDGTILPGFNPEIRDLCVIIVRATPSNIPANPLGCLSTPQSQGGLGIAVHEVNASQVGNDRTLSPNSPQKCLRITESLSPSGNILGIANQGTVNGLDEATVFTERIRNYVFSVYADAGAAVPNNVQTAIIEPYIRQTMCHEAGHAAVDVTATYNSRFGGNHERAGGDAIMTQSISVSTKRGNVTFSIPTVYSSANQSEAILF